MADDDKTTSDTYWDDEGDLVQDESLLADLDFTDGDEETQE